METVKRILIVEDDISSAFDILKALHDEPNVVFQLASNQSDGLKAIYDDTKWDAAIFDIKLPSSDFSGLYKHGDQLSVLTKNDGGLLLAAAFHELFPGRPMVIRTGFLRAVRDQVDPLLEAGACIVIEKGFETSSIHDLKKYLFQKPKKKTVGEIAWDAVLCLPGVWGFSFDLKKFLREIKENLRR